MSGFYMRDLPRCKKCGSVAAELLNGLCANCNPELAESHKRREKEEQHKRDLYWALRSRVLTAEEMQEVENLDYYLLVVSGQPYYPKDVKAEFNAALLQQFKMRLAAEREEKK